MKHGAAEEQLIYADILDRGMKLGLILLIITFFLYAFDILSPHIPVNDLPKYWGMNVHDYLLASETEAGWSWLGMLEKGDYVNFVGIAFLSSITVACYVSIIPTFLRKNDKVYALLAIAETAVLVLAASGLLKSGGH